MNSSCRAVSPAWFSAGTGCFLLAVNAPLLGAWVQDPACKSAPIAFGFWLLPVAVEFFRKQLFAGTCLWMSAALLLGVAGSIGELQVLKHTAFALWIAGFFPWWPMRWIQWPAAISWMPAWGWVSQRFLELDPYWSRLGFAVAGILALALVSRLKRPNPPWGGRTQ